MSKEIFTRREFLKLVGAAALAAGCKGVGAIFETPTPEKPTPKPTKEPTVKPSPLPTEVPPTPIPSPEFLPPVGGEKPETPQQTITSSPTKEVLPTPTVEIEATPAVPVPVKIIEKEGQRLKVGGLEVFPPGVTFGENTTAFFAAKDIEAESLTKALEARRWVFLKKW